MSSLMKCVPWISAPYKFWFILKVLIAHYDAGHRLIKTLILTFITTILTVFVCIKYAIVDMVMGDLRCSMLPNPFYKPWLAHKSIIDYKWDLVLNPYHTQSFIIVDSTALKATICGLSTITSRKLGRSSTDKLISRDKITTSYFYLVKAPSFLVWDWL